MRNEPERQPSLRPEDRLEAGRRAARIARKSVRTRATGWPIDATYVLKIIGPNMEAPSHIQQKHTDSAYALLQAASLPYENFSERSGTVVPGVFPGPESQLTDIITTEVEVDPTLKGYIEVCPEVSAPLAMTYSGLMASSADDTFGTFVYQSDPSSTQCMSGSLQSPTRFRSVMVQDYAIPYVPDIAILGSVRFIRRTLSPHPLLLVSAEYSVGGGVWVNAAPVTLMDTLSINVALTVPVGAQLIRFPVTVQGAIATQFALDITVRIDSGTFHFPQSWSTLRLYPWPYLSGLPPTQFMRRIAQDALFTWTGSTLENGGKIAGALVPFSYSPGNPNPFTAVSQLRVDRMDGPIKFGASGTWRPSSLREIDRISVLDWNPARLKLAFGYSFSSSDGSARIRTFGMFGFTSTNPIIGRMMWTPAMTPAMVEALGLYFESFPALTTNAEHVALKALKSAGRIGAKGLKALLEQDDKIALLATTLGHPEIAAAVKVAGTASRTITANRKAQKAKKAAKK